MATIPTQTHPLLAFPFNAATDFTVLASHCENFAETLFENDDPTLKMAFCGTLNAADSARSQPSEPRLTSTSISR